MRKILLQILVIIMFVMTVSAGSIKSIYDFEKEVKNILKKASPSIVKVVAENHRKHVATGIIISNSKILSNIMITKYHYNRIYIETKDKKKYPVKLKGKDKRTGLILLESKNKNMIPLKRGKVGETGDWIVLVGAFYNKIPAIYQGIISSTSKEELILNAPLPPGSIGSAVLNRDGNLIGVVRGKLKFSSSPSYSFKNEGGNITILSKRSKDNALCYAVPIQRVNNIVSQIKKYGKVKWGWLGVNIDLYKKKKGILITSIIKNSPASKSELRKGDIILNINNVEMNTVLDVQKTVRRIFPGQKVKLIVKRNGQIKNFWVKIGEKKGYQEQIAKKMEFSIPKNIQYKNYFDDISRFPKVDLERFKINISGTPKLGINIKTLNKRDATKFKNLKDYGLLITGVSRNSAAEKYGIKKWDILIGSDGKKIKTSNDLRTILKKSKPNKKIPFTICRNGKIKNLYVVPKHKYSFNKKYLKESLKDLSLLFSDEFEIENELIINELEKKAQILEKKSKYLSGKDKDKLKKEIYLLEKSIEKKRQIQYKKLKAELKKIQFKIKKLEKIMNK